MPQAAHGLTERHSMYSFDSRIRYSECDETARLDYVALVNYLQDCSTFHT